MDVLGVKSVLKHYLHYTNMNVILYGGHDMHTHGLTKRTKERKEEMVVALSKKPIKDLWDKQALVKGQQKHMFDLYIKATKSHNYDEVKRLELVSAELAAAETDLKDAIRRK